MTIARAPEDRMTEEEGLAMKALLEAHRWKNEAAKREYRPAVRLLPESLLAMKRSRGAGFIRELGFNTELADKYCAAGWLDQAEPAGDQEPYDPLLDAVEDLVSMRDRVKKTQAPMPCDAEDFNKQLVAVLEALAKEGDVVMKTLQLELSMVSHEREEMAVDNPAEVAELDTALTELAAAKAEYLLLRDHPDLYRAKYGYPPAPP